jgi:hypothetical protein
LGADTGCKTICLRPQHPADMGTNGFMCCRYGHCRTGPMGRERHGEDGWKILRSLCSEDGPRSLHRYISSYHLVNVIFMFLGPLRLFLCTKSSLRKEDLPMARSFVPGHSVLHRTGVQVVLGMWLHHHPVCHRIVERRLASSTPSMAIGLLQQNKVQVLARSLRLYLSQPIRHVPNKCLLCGSAQYGDNSRLCEITRPRAT